MKKLKNDKGITLVALVVTIIVLLILAGVALSAVLSQDGIFSRAENSANRYNKAKEREGKILSNVIESLDSASNNKPQIKLLKYFDRTENSMKITAMATDENDEKLSYKLYVGTTRENLIEQTDIKKDIEQGTEVTWDVTTESSSLIYYYKVVVSDKYSDIDSGIKATNNPPQLGEITLENDLDDTTGNWVKVTTSATDAENNILTYTLKMWKKKEGINEEELIKQEPTKTVTKKDVNVGEITELKISERLRRVSRLCLLCRSRR